MQEVLVDVLRGGCYGGTVRKTDFLFFFEEKTSQVIQVIKYVVDTVFFNDTFLP